MQKKISCNEIEEGKINCYNDPVENIPDLCQISGSLTLPKSRSFLEMQKMLTGAMENGKYKASCLGVLSVLFNRGKETGLIKPELKESDPMTNEESAWLLDRYAEIINSLTKTAENEAD